jgi:hypothetical protein
VPRSSDQFEHVAAGGEAVEIARESAPHPEQLAAQKEGQIRVRPLLEDGADAYEGLEGPGEAAQGVLGPLGDPGHLTVLLGQQRDDSVRLTIGAGTKDQSRGTDLGGHATVLPRLAPGF